MHRLVQLSVQDWLAEGQENRRVATTRVRVCGVELSPMQRSYVHELRGYFRIISGYGLYSMYPYLQQSAQIAYQEIGLGLLLKFRSLKACHHFAQ
jgi:hypothetical protein